MPPADWCGTITERRKRSIGSRDFDKHRDVLAGVGVDLVAEGGDLVAQLFSRLGLGKAHFVNTEGQASCEGREVGTSAMIRGKVGEGFTNGGQGGETEGVQRLESWAPVVRCLRRP